MFMKQLCHVGVMSNKTEFYGQKFNLKLYFCDRQTFLQNSIFLIEIIKEIMHGRA